MWATTTHQLIVWGGETSTSTGVAAGMRWEPATATWKSMAPPPASFAGRSQHTAIWTGTKMVVFGGRGCGTGTYCGDAAAYDPVTDAWTLLDAPPIDGRRLSVALLLEPGATAGWTLFWGGYGAEVAASVYRGDGALLDASGTWSLVPAVPTSVLPSARRAAAASWWANGKAHVWGGITDGGAALGDGAALDPTTGTWTALPATGAPPARGHATAVWTGKEAIVWGGFPMEADGRIYRP